jgi:hypothetical protein
VTYAVLITFLVSLSMRCFKLSLETLVECEQEVARNGRKGQSRQGLHNGQGGGHAAADVLAYVHHYLDFPERGK